MKWTIVNRPLGMGCSAGHPVKKEMPIPLAIPLVMAAASAAASIYGGAKSAQANKEAQAKLEAERVQTEAERRRRMNEDFLDTSAGQNLLRVARDERDKIWKRAAGAAAVSGGTDAATAQAKEAGNRMIADAVANIAAQDSQRKDTADAAYRQQLSAIKQQQIANEQAKGQTIAQAAGGASSALMQGALSTFGGTKLGQSWFGAGSPGGGGVSTTGAPSTPAQLQQMGSSLFQINNDYALLQKSYLYNPEKFWSL